MGWILDTAQDQLGAKTFSYYGWWKEKQKNSTLYGLKYEVLISGILSRITGLHGIWNIFGTYALIKKISPDIIHLHNLHMWNTNVPMVDIVCRRIRSSYWQIMRMCRRT